MKSSTNRLLVSIFSPDDKDVNSVLIPTNSPQVPSKGSKAAPRSTLNSPTICTQFKTQLTILMNKIQSTKPHYIRCIKPNDLNAPDSLDRLRTTEQLRYGGVLEAVRVARSGFPVRLSHEDFYGRYRILANPFNAPKSMPRYLPLGVKSEDASRECAFLLELVWDTSVPQTSIGDKGYTKLVRRIKESQYWWGPKSNVQPNSVQIGASKVFFRKQAHDLLESRRSKCLGVNARRIQASFRRFSARCGYLNALAAVRRLQIMVRYLLFHIRFVRKRRLGAAIKIQSAFRQSFHNRRYMKFRRATMSLQSAFRVKLAQRILFALKITKYSMILQKHFRRCIARFRYVRILHAVRVLQGKFRISVAKEELKSLRIQARDLGKLQRTNEEMKAEIDRLRSAMAIGQNKQVEVDEKSISPLAIQTPLKVAADKQTAPPSTNSKQRFHNFVEEFRRKMLVGMVARVYTMTHGGLDTLVTVREPSSICFTKAPSFWSFFSSFLSGFPAIPSINVCDIIEISSGLTSEAIALFPTITQKEKAANLFVTIQFRPSMICAIGTSSPDERNFLLNGIRALMSETQITLTSQFFSSSKFDNSANLDGDSVENKVQQLAAQVITFQPVFSFFYF